MIATLRYVMCDRCFAPAGDGNDMRDTAKEARAQARQLGWVRRAGQDLCLACAAPENPPAHSGGGCLPRQDARQ